MRFKLTVGVRGFLECSGSRSCGYRSTNRSAIRFKARLLIPLPLCRASLVDTINSCCFLIRKQNSTDVI